MNADHLPLNQPVIVSNTSDFRATATRLSDDIVELAYHDQRPNDETLMVLAHVDGTSSELAYFDKVYWNITVNGRPATEADLQDLLHKRGLAMAIDPKARLITVISK